MDKSIADLRKEYLQQSLLEKDVETDPILQFKKWWDQALAAGVDEPNAMTLATASRDAVPSARIVLLKEFNANGFVFFTNYNSYKGQQLSENPKACLVFSGSSWNARFGLPVLFLKFPIKKVMNIIIRGRREAVSEPGHRHKARLLKIVIGWMNSLQNYLKRKRVCNSAARYSGAE